jgi:glycosyltransferase involved in cell wall biosynthesis
MRILIAHEAAAGAGGVESYLAAIMPALIARGHELAFVSDTSRSVDGPTRLDSPAVSLSVEDDGLPAVMDRLRKWRPDVCFSHNMGRLDVDESLMSLGPVVKMMHGYFGTCISGQKAHTFPGVEACCRTFGVPCLGLFLPRRCGQLRPAVMLEQFRWTTRQQGLFARYAHVIVASRHMAAEYERHGVAASRVTAAPLFATVTSAEAPRIAPSDPTVLFLGRMTPIKGGDVLIRAAAHARRILGRPVRLLFAGNGPAEPSWRELAMELEVDASFHGWVTGPARTALLRSASLIAVPSLWPEPFGLVGLEAAVHGVPAVAFDVGGISEWLHDDVNGRLVGERGDITAFGAAIGHMSADLPLARLGAGALRVASVMTLGAHLDTMERVLAEASAAKAAA